jgi:hypothetical protein
MFYWIFTHMFNWVQLSSICTFTHLQVKWVRWRKSFEQLVKTIKYLHSKVQYDKYFTLHTTNNLKQVVNVVIEDSHKYFITKQKKYFITIVWYNNPIQNEANFLG